MTPRLHCGMECHGSRELLDIGRRSEGRMVRLDSTCCKLLSKDHRRLVAGLTILELALSPENAQAKAVQLVQEGAHGKTKK